QIQGTAPATEAVASSDSSATKLPPAAIVSPVDEMNRQSTAPLEKRKRGTKSRSKRRSRVHATNRSSIFGFNTGTYFPPSPFSVVPHPEGGTIFKRRKHEFSSISRRDGAQGADRYHNNQFVNAGSIGSAGRCTTARKDVRRARICRGTDQS